MKFYTQTNLTPGNCFQTAIACILEVNPERLPPQHEIESWDEKVLDGWGSYSNVLNGYLRRHHGLRYVEIHKWMMGAVMPVRPEHIICGPSPRTDMLTKDRAKHIHHCVVGVNGHPVWDVHPSRAGLTGVECWGLLATDAPWQRDDSRKADDQIYQLVFGCLCPTCGLDRARARNHE
jgi:hypothetical protein